MTESVSTTDSFRSEMSRLLETEGKDALKTWAKLLKTGGKKLVKRNCEYCDRRNSFEVDVIDAEEQRRILDFLASNTLTKPVKDDAATSIADIRGTLDDYSDAEVAALAGLTADDYKEFQIWQRHRATKAGIRSAKSDQPSK